MTGKIVRIISWFTALFVVMLFGISSGIKAETPKGAVPGKYIVKLKSGVKSQLIGNSLSSGSKFRKSTKLKIKPDLKGSKSWDRYFTYYTSDKNLSLEQIIEEIGAENIEFIEQDHYIEFFEYPTDSLFTHQWYLNNIGQEYYGIQRGPDIFDDSLVLKTGTPGKDFKLNQFYESPPEDSTKVVVAIIDTGVDTKHPELQGRFWKNPDEIPGDGIDNDQNGYIDDTLGYDVSGDIINLFNPVGDNDPMDGNGHGTHVAGIIAANANGFGIVGIAPWVEIMAIKIRPNISNTIAAEGILYAVNSGAQIINISWGTPFVSGILEEAIEFAVNNGVLVCIAPGNTGTNERFFPAAYDDINTVIVGAGNSDGFMTSFSTYGEHIDIIAPGKDILSLRADTLNLYDIADIPENNYLRVIDSFYLLADGTSMATPVVCGAAALLLSFRPDLTLEELRFYLLSGAVDITDPWGDHQYNLVGPDTITGHGYLNIYESYLRLIFSSAGSIDFVEPELKKRYTTGVNIKIAPVGIYAGGWELEYIFGYDSVGWLPLASGISIPSDSIIYFFDELNVNGNIKLRLIDDGGSIAETSFMYVRNRKVELITPVNDQEVKFSFAVMGTGYGPDFDSLQLYYYKIIDENEYVFSSTGEHFDSVLYNWVASGDNTGDFMMVLVGYFGNNSIKDSAAFRVTSAFASGWPQSFNGNTGITPVCADLDKDGLKELIITTNVGLLIYNADGSLKNKDGQTYLSGINVICVPAVYDIDRDGQDEIILTSDTTLHVINHDGSYAPGFPVYAKTGTASGGYGYPTPIVTQLGMGEDSAIVFINILGQLYAYQFDGDPYFYSLEGFYASAGAGVRNEAVYVGKTLPFISSSDFNGDGINEVVASFSSNHLGGISLFDARTGNSTFDLESTLLQRVDKSSGMTLADLNGDGLHEIITIGFDDEFLNDDSLKVPVLWIKTNGVEDLAGWPVAMNDVPEKNWIPSIPVAADLDLDGIPEIMISYFGFGEAYLYIFKSDGTAYLPGGVANGQAFFAPVTFGNPTVADVTGDSYPEILLRSGNLLPGMGTEKLYILDYQANLLPDFPIETPALPFQVISTQFAPLVDDIDGDGMVEVAMYSNANQLLVWDFDADSRDGKNMGRFLMDNLNSGQLPIEIMQTASEKYEISLPGEFSLGANYPNPFNPVTKISFSIPSMMKVELEIFNVLGRKVESLVNQELDEGIYKVEFDGSQYASGVYLYRLTAGDKKIVRKMVLLK